ncbi:MAG: hypothetical protein LBD64_05255, partial [Odoribacteraceae bacterium]|nr:hypothetical protein [Odoribacteraceae bacterium]
MGKEIEIDQLLARYHDGKLSTREREMLRAWAGDSPANHQLLELVAGAAGAREDLSEMCKHDREKAWRMIQEAARAREQRRSRVRAARRVAAAVILVAVGLSLPRNEE